MTRRKGYQGQVVVEETPIVVPLDVPVTTVVPTSLPMPRPCGKPEKALSEEPAKAGEGGEFIKRRGKLIRS